MHVEDVWKTKISRLEALEPAKFRPDPSTVGEPSQLPSPVKLSIISAFLVKTGSALQTSRITVPSNPIQSTESEEERETTIVPGNR